MIHGAIAPDLANYPRDEDDLVSRVDSVATNINPTPCPLAERTPTTESEAWSETAQSPAKDDVTLIPITPCRSKVRNSTEVAIADSHLCPSIPVNPVHEGNILGRAQFLEERIDALAITSPEARSLSDHLLPADITLSSSDLTGPITVRDLPNATPRPTPSPKPESMSCLGVPIDMAGKEALPGAVTTGCTDPEAFIPSLEELDLDNDFVPYNVDAEPLPVGPFADRDYQDAVKAGKHLAKNVADHLGTCTTAPQVNTQLHKIQKQAQELQRFDSPATRTIALIGDSAAGKSSLINSLLHLPDLAHKGDRGSAVTSFVTEYRRRTHEHPEPFTIEAEYATEEEIKEQIHELLYSFRLLYMPGLQDELSNSDDKFRAIERESEIAMLTLQSIFPDRREAQPEYLRGEWGGTSNFTCQEIEAELQRLAEGLSWPEGAANGKWSSTAANATECHEKVENFMKHGLWPLTNVVRIYLSAQILKTGIILADLPGYRDINFARVRKAEQYLVCCDEIFVVANINRVITNASVKDCLRSSLSPNLKINRSVSIICTRADDIDLKDSAKVYSAVTELDSTKAARKAKELAKRARGRNDSKERADTKYKYIYVSARNAEIKKTLLANYASEFGSANLNVFCVGNIDYDMEGDLRMDPEARNIAIEGSGIPELRRHCHTIVSRAQFRASNHFLEVEIPDLVQSLEVWVESAEQDSVPSFPPNCVPELEKTLLAKVYGASEALRHRADTGILQFWSHNEEAFNREAIKVSEQWTSWHHTSYKAWVRANGTYGTQAQGFRRWNDEILGEANRLMSDQWTELFIYFKKQIDKTQKFIGRKITELRSQLGDLQVSQTLIVMLKLKEREIMYLLREETEETSGLCQDFRTLESNATGDDANSFILNVMIPTYRDCIEEHGTGMKKRMHDIMARKMASGSVFRSMHDKMQKGMNRWLDGVEDKFKNHIIAMCLDLEQQVKTACGTEAGEFRNKTPRDLKAVKKALTLGRETLPQLQQLASAAVAEARKEGYIL